MSRRVVSALLFVLALFFVSTADAAELAKAPTIDLYTIGASGYVYSRFGHSFLCVRPAGAAVADQTATCYDYGVPDRQDILHITLTAVKNEVGFFPLAVPEKAILDLFKEEGRAVERQQIPLMPDEVARLVKILEDEAAHKVGYAYHPYWANCATKLRDHLDTATNGRLHPGPFTPMPGNFRELMEEGHSGHLVELTLMALLLGNPGNNRVPTPWESMFLPFNLRDGVRDRLGAPIEKLTERQAVILPTSRAIGRFVLFFLAFALSATIRIASRKKGLRLALKIAGVVFGLLGTLIALVSAIAAWPEIRHNYALLLLVPTDFALPLLAKRRVPLVVYLRARLGIAVLLGALELFHVIDQPMLPLVALVVFPMMALLRALSAEQEAKTEAAKPPATPVRA